MAVLRIVQGCHAGEIIPIRGDCLTLGRDPGRDVVIACQSVSRYHARLIRVGADYTIEDSHSRNGTFVNNQVLHGPRRLTNGDSIRLCEFIAIYHDQPPYVEPVGGEGPSSGTILRVPALTQQQWRTCDDPRSMLAFLHHAPSDRKLRLFACACCRRVWDSLRDATNRQGVETAERYADGEVSLEELRAARLAAQDYGLWETPAVYHTLGEGGGFHCCAAREVVWACERKAGDPDDLAAERSAQSDLCRDIFHPFLLPRLDPRWLAWEGGQIVSLAQAAYADRRLPGGTLDGDRLAILADALEEAGCPSAELLDHLRQSTAHVRGCWAVDLLTGRA